MNREKALKMVVETPERAASLLIIFDRTIDDLAAQLTEAKQEVKNLAAYSFR